MGTLINPGRPKAQDETDFLSEPIYLRNPTTGMIFKLTHKDTVTRCLREFYTPSSEAEMLAQAVELAELQGRPLPATAPAPAPAPKADETPADSAHVGKR